MSSAGWLVLNAGCKPATPGVMPHGAFLSGVGKHDLYRALALAVLGVSVCFVCVYSFSLATYQVPSLQKACWGCLLEFGNPTDVGWNASSFMGLAVWSWISKLTFLSFYFLSSKISVIIPNSQSCWGDEMRSCTRYLTLSKCSTHHRWYSYQH